jgi:transposase
VDALRAGPAARLSEQGRADGRDETEPLDGPWGARGRMSERHSMRKVREVLRLRHVQNLSERQIAAALEIGHSTVGDYLKRAARAGLVWEDAERLSDAEVEARLFQQVGWNEPTVRAPIDFAWVHMELRRAGVTLELLWTEYQQAVADRGSGQKPYQYSQFCELYRGYKRKLSPVMRQVHRAGEKAFIDFSGRKPRLIDPTTGAENEVELFVMVLGASNYTYAEATRTQSLGDFVGATVRGLEYFGAVPEILMPDQLKSAVSKPDRVDPDINATYAEMAQHYSTAVVPARPYKPRDKAKVEAGVQIAQRWILACLRNRRFFSLEELNAAIWEQLEKLNTRPFQKLEGCRRSAFEKLDRPAMKPLPAWRYEVGARKLGVGVNIDYHFEYDHRVYSVPSELINEKVDVRATATMVEVWRGGVRVTSHERSYGPKGTAVTRPEHRPRSHREWGQWPPERLVAWAAQTGPKTADVVAAILAHRTHPETGRRACLGLMRLAERHGVSRLEAACARALVIGNPRYKTVETILKTGLDKVALEEEVETKRIVHENIRGGAYFDREEVNGSANVDEIEARYLEEERFAIMNEPEVAPRRQETRRSVGEDVASVALRSAPRPTSPSVLMQPLPALLGRLQALWSAPSGRARGGADSQVGPCTSPSMCIEEESNRGEDMNDGMTCHLDDGAESSKSRRGEV